jgi:hypothetical protein
MVICTLWCKTHQRSGFTGEKKILQDPSIQGVKQVYEGLIRFQHWKFHSKQFQKLVNQDGEKILSHTK